MCCITDMAENLRNATAMLSRNAEDMSKRDLMVSLKMVDALASVLQDRVDDMNHINALHEFYLARSEYLEGLNIEVE